MKKIGNSIAVSLRQRAAQNIETILASQTLTNLKNKFLVVTRAAAPIFGIVLLNLLAHEAAQAQNGPIFSGSANNLANIIREGLKLFAILLFCAGILGGGSAVWNKMWGKEWSNYAIGAGGCFAFSTITAVLYSLSQGQAVTVDTNF